VQGPQRAQLLQQAVELYRAALAQEEDAAVRQHMCAPTLQQGLPVLVELVCRQLLQLLFTTVLMQLN
jgi:hypothetical protein